MRKVCSFCLAECGPAGTEEDAVSHGMCAACYAHFVPQWEGLTLAEYLDRFEVPVVVVEGNWRFQAVNAAFVRLYGIDSRAGLGLLGGEAMECVHARLPGGCGRTVHCQTCAIRRTVTRALATGEPQVGVPATLARDAGEVALRLSAEPRGALVVLRIEPA